MASLYSNVFTEHTPVNKFNHSESLLHTPVYFSSSDDDSIINISSTSKSIEILSEKSTELQNEHINLSPKTKNGVIISDHCISVESVKSDKKYGNVNATVPLNFDHDENLSSVKDRYKKIPRCLDELSSCNSMKDNVIVNKSKLITKDQNKENLESTSDAKSIVSSLDVLAINDNFATSKDYVTPQKKFQPVIWDSDDSSEEEFSAINKIERKPRQIKKSFLESLSMYVPNEEADTEAMVYRQNFKITKYELTVKLFRLFNEKIFSNKLPMDMTIEWNDRLLRSAGYAKNSKNKGIKTSSISLSTKLLDSASRLRDTLLHEMCHVATWLISGVHDAHGPMWKNWAIRCKIVFPEVEVPTRCHNYDINYKYTYKCTKCGKNIGRHSKSINVQKHVCPCGGKLELTK